MKNYFPISIAILVFSFLCFYFYTPINFNTIKYVKIAGQNIKVELAVTAEQQDQGLSGRSELKVDEGMLFIFPHPGKYSFWMKDMNFGIDIIWISENKKVVYIKKNASIKEYPNAYVSENNAKYVLEIVAGFSDQNNLKVGDKVEFGY